MGFPSKFRGTPGWVSSQFFSDFLYEFFGPYGFFGVLLTLGCALPVSLSRLIVLKTPERLTHPFRILKISGAVLPS